MAFRPPATIFRAILGVGLTLLGYSLSAPGQPLDQPLGPAPTIPEPPGLEARPAAGMDPNEAIREYESSLRTLARTVEDPALRATTLNLVARSEIIARRLPAAHDDLIDAGRAASSIPPGLIRDLRLMAIITNHVDLAHEEVVEAVPNNPPTPDSKAATMPFSARKPWLDMALDEWHRAAALGRLISNDTYRSERLAAVVQGQSADVLKIGRDATFAATSRIDLEGQVPELLASVDQIARQAAQHAGLIERAVWSDQVLSELAVSLARSQQFARCLSIARSMPRPVTRCQVLLRDGEELSRVAADLRQRFAADVLRTWDWVDQALRDNRLQAQLPAAPVEVVTSSPEDAVAELQTRLDALADAVQRLQRQASMLEAFYLHERVVLKEENLGIRPLEEPLVASSHQMMEYASRLNAAIADYRMKYAERLDQARAKEGKAKDDALHALIPSPDDPAIVQLREEVQTVSRHMDAVADPADRGATFAYNEAARSVAAIELPDPRMLMAHRMVESLVAVGRFADARAATVLFTDPNRRLFVLGEIAESQGRRNLADVARKWIETEVAPEHRATLLRRVSQGVLTSVDQLRSQSSSIPGVSAGGIR